LIRKGFSTDCQTVQPADILLPMTDKQPTPIVRFDIRSIPKKPPAPSVRGGSTKRWGAR
jgi:hypothetical protein